MSLGLLVLEKKLFTRTRTPTPQSDDIMSADIKMRPVLSSATTKIQILELLHEPNNSASEANMVVDLLKVTESQFQISVKKIKITLLSVGFIHAFNGNTQNTQSL